MDAAATALADLVRHVLLPARRRVLRAAARAAATRSRTGRAASASARRPGSTSAPRRPGLLPTPEWRQQTFAEADRTRDRPALEAGRLDPARDRPGDLLVTPLQMARFYALIANGGKLVTPHIVADVEQPRPNGGRRSSASGSRRPRRSRPTSTRPRSRSCATASTRRRTRSIRHRDRRLRQLPGPDRRQDRHGREGRRRRGYERATARPVVVVRLRARRRARRSSSAP